VLCLAQTGAPPLIPIHASDDGPAPACDGDDDATVAAALTEDAIEAAILSAVSTHDADAPSCAGPHVGSAKPCASSLHTAAAAAVSVVVGVATAAAGAVATMAEHATNVPEWIDAAKEGDQLDPLPWEGVPGVSVKLATRIVRRDGSGGGVQQKRIATSKGGQEHRIMCNILCHASAEVCALGGPHTCAHV